MLDKEQPPYKAPVGYLVYKTIPAIAASDKVHLWFQATLRTTSNPVKTLIVMHSLTYTPPADDSIPPIDLNLGMYDNLSRMHPFSAEQGQEAVHGRETEAFQFRSILQNFEWRSTHHCLVIVPCTSCSNVVINRFMYIYTWPLHCLYTRSSELWW